MAHIELNGFDDYISRIEALSEKSAEMMKESIYPAAGMITDKVREKLQSLEADNKRYTKYTRVMHYEQKKGLLEGLGLARMEETSHGIHTKVGFSGYNKLQSKTYPRGQPNLMIARVVESGTTYQKKQPFMRPVVNAYKKEAEKIIKDILEEKIKEVMK